MHGRYERSLRILLAILVALSLANVAAAARPPDAWITLRVKLSLLTSEGLSATHIDVDTIDGRVTLHGSVPTDAELARAEQTARQVAGFSKVRNLLQVVAAPQAAATRASDAQIEDAVEASLKAHPALAKASIRVQSVNAGVVLLAGETRTLTETFRAVDVAARVPGVRRVASEIRSPDAIGDDELWREGAYDAAAYQKSAASDTWITTAAKLRLIANGETPGFDINVDTHDGIVTLFGVVGTEDAKRTADAEVRRVGGVRNVVNDLQIVPNARQSRVAKADAQIREAIQAGFDANGNLDDAAIYVAVSNGVARLTGKVNSRRDQVAALTVARSTLGVVRVIDELRLAAPELSAR